MTLRVGIDGKSLIPPRTGVGRYLAGLLAGCGELAATEVDLDVLSPRVARRTLPWVLWDLQRASRTGFSVLHLPFYYGPLAPRCPTVVAVHDLLAIEHPEWFPFNLVSPIRTLMPRTVRRAAGIVTFSTSVAAAVVERFRVAPGRVRVIPHGVDGSRFAPPAAAADAELRARYTLRDPYLLQVGSLEARRGIDLAIDAAAMVRRRLGPLDLILAGDVRSEVEALERTPSWVRRLGWVADVDLAVLLAGAAAVLAPSRGEGFDLPVLEALACGAVVVASDIPPHVEHFADGVELFRSGDAESLAAAVLGVVEDPVRASSRRREGPRIASRFRWADSARQHLALWREAAV